MRTKLFVTALLIACQATFADSMLDVGDPLIAPENNIYMGLDGFGTYDVTQYASSDFLALLTNNEDNFLVMYIMFAGSSGYVGNGAKESDWGLNPAAFAGQTITKISMIVHDLQTIPYILTGDVEWQFFTGDTILGSIRHQIGTEYTDNPPHPFGFLLWYYPEMDEAAVVPNPVAFAGGLALLGGLGVHRLRRGRR